MPWLTADMVVALLGATGGGFAVKVLDGHYRLREKNIDAGAGFRGELHSRVLELTAQLKEAQVDAVVWRDRYYHLFEHASLLRAAAQGIRKELIATGRPVAELEQLESGMWPEREV